MVDVHVRNRKRHATRSSRQKKFDSEPLTGRDPV